MAGGLVAWNMVAAPQAQDFSFDMPALVGAPASASDLLRVAGRVEERQPSTTTTEATATTIVEVTTTTGAPPPPPPPAPALATFDRIPPNRPNSGGDKHPVKEVPAIGMVEIAKIGLVHPVFEGFDVSEIHWGPGHWPGTAMPGHTGNAVFAGHRVTHTRPFLDIDLLVPGDRMVFRTAEGTFTYEVTSHEIVAPDATWIAQPTAEATVTIFACHPKRSAKQRYVVRGRLVDSQF